MSFPFASLHHDPSVVAWQRRWQFVPEAVREVSNWDAENREFRLPRSAEELASKLVVVCTCMTAAKLWGWGVAPGHFSHVLVDEAAQAMEPECLLAFADVLRPNGTLVLTGDPKQLGYAILLRAAPHC